MDNSDLALLAVGFLSENLTKGVLSAVGKDIWTLISEAFSTDSEKKSLETLNNMPSDSLVRGKVIGKLEEVLEANPMLSTQLKKILDNAPQMLKNNAQNVVGDSNTTIQDINSSHISIHGQ
ncbi:hypothetical protein [Spirosoma luteum]|uniref:hypothetical protein n=1 Tax=Spirosoma luteum TaxID=431553 RepID=UPI0003673A26|nr:hypothetical protein [Spirosoma luteum]